MSVAKRRRAAIGTNPSGPDRVGTTLRVGLPGGETNTPVLRSISRPGLRKIRVERETGIEPAYEAWEAAVLPLNYTREAVSLLEYVAQAEVLELHVVVDAVVRTFAAKAGLLYAAKRHDFVGDHARIHAD